MIMIVYEIEIIYNNDDDDDVHINNNNYYLLYLIPTQNKPLKLKFTDISKFTFPSYIIT